MRLLIPALDADDAVLSVGGQPWRFRELDDALLFGPENFGEYTCVSYAWGSGKVQHPLEPEHHISDRAWSVLEAVIRTRAPKAIWIDALCVPSEAEAQARTLRLLAAIYAHAQEVTVVLSTNCLPLFHEYEQKLPISTPTLERLEAEPWDKRFWTYQELAKSAEVSFVAQEGTNVVITGSELANCVGQALWQADKAGGAPAFPAAANLVDALASWLHTGTEPFVYQALVGSAGRIGTLPADRYNALLSMIAPGSLTSSDPLAACEQLMVACEAKGDLSFIYVRSARSQEPGRSWRPAAGELTPILTWHTFGDGQRGEVTPTLVRLHDMVSAGATALDDRARAFIEEYLALVAPAANEQPLTERVARLLGAMGYPASLPAIELGLGLLFPLATPGSWSLALIATGVRWAHGAPALLVDATGLGNYRVVGVGVFVGPLSNSIGASFDVV